MSNSLNNKLSALTTKAHIPDLVQNQYNAHKLNHVWFVDFSDLGIFWIFVIVDSASKRVISYFIKPGNTASKKSRCTINATECVKTLANTFNENEPPLIIHSDRGGQFYSKIYSTFLKSYGIKQSIVDTNTFKFGNQVIERFFRTLKDKLKEIEPNYKNLKDKNKINDFVKQVITEYNNTIHKSLNGLSPNSMQDALVLHQPDLDSTKPFIAKTSSDSYKSLEVQQIKATITQKYAGDWITFFFEWKKQLVQELKIEMQNNTQIIINEYKITVETLTKQITLLQKSLTAMEQKALQAEADLKTKQEAKLRRKNRNRLPSRDTAGFYELQLVIKFVLEQKSSSEFVKSRDIVCFCILFFTGLRVSNLLKLKVSHIHQLLSDYKFDLPLIKKKQSVIQTFFIPTAAYSQFDDYKEHFIRIIHNKNHDDFVITSENNNILISRVFLTRSLNSILSPISKFTHKNIKTHSFRINLTTALIEAVGIEAASKAMGHNDIKTTEMYNRRTLSISDMAKAYTKAHKLLASIANKKIKRKLVQKDKLTNNTSI